MGDYSKQCLQKNSNNKMITLGEFKYEMGGDNDDQY